MTKQANKQTKRQTNNQTTKANEQAPKHQTQPSKLAIRPLRELVSERKASQPQACLYFAAAVVQY